MEITQQIKTRQDAAFKYLKDKRLLWDDVEKLFHNQLQDAVSATTKSQVFDPKLATLAIERCYRVMSQLPAGKVKAISKNDVSSSLIMNMLLDKYILPNANAQFDILTKFRMTDMYSNIYGNFFALVDWSVRKDGYIGPDMWLLNIRDIFPQVGAVSINDSDYIIVRTWKSMEFFESISPKAKGYKNVDKIIEKLKKKSGSKDARSSDDKSKREEGQYSDASSAKNSGFFEIWTQYEKDRWVDYVVDADEILRDGKNPHENDSLPVVCKHSIPLLDDFMGMGDFERGKSMQMVINSVWNLYLDACKLSIYPPVVINKDTIASSASFRWGPAAKWLIRGQLDNSVKTIQLSPQGIPTFNNTYNTASASLLNLFGTTDTSVRSDVEAGFGRTPQALKMQAARENTRDSADRFFMETFLVDVVKKMINLVSKKQTGDITFRLFHDDIKQLERIYPDIANHYNEKTGKFNADKDITGSVLYDYEVIPGSTYVTDQQQQQNNLQGLLTMISQNPQLLQRIEQDYKVRVGELFKRAISNSGIQDWGEIIIEKTEEEKSRELLESHSQQLMQAIQGGGGFGMNQVPPQPEGMPGGMPGM